MIPIRARTCSHLGEGGGGPGSVVVVLGEGLGAGEHEGAILGLLRVVVILVVHGVDVNAGEPFHGDEECHDHARAHPDPVPLQDPAAAVVVAVVAAVHGCRPTKTRRKEGNGVESAASSCVVFEFFWDCFGCVPKLGGAGWRESRRRRTVLIKRSYSNRLPCHRMHACRNPFRFPVFKMFYLLNKNFV